MERRYMILRYDAKSDGRKGDPGGAPPKLETETLSVREAADLERDPQTEVVAPAMPIRLIRPVSIRAQSGEEAAASAGNWGISAIEAEASPWSGAGVTVAALDSGIDAAHPAFAGMRLIQRDFTGDGDDDKDGHGTHCAGTIFGRDVGGRRIGVARGVTRALIGKVLDDQKAGQSDWIFEAMLWAAQEGADVVSMSVAFDFPGAVRKMVREEGWPEDLATSAVLETYRANLRMCDAVMGVLGARKAFGTSPLVVAATGNESKRAENPSYRIAASLPAAAEGVISVGAVGRGGEAARHVVAPFSNSKPILCAPGVEILSAAAGGGLAVMDGTSMACPHVAGAAALWFEKLRREGKRADAQTVAAQLIAMARRDLLAEGLGIEDVGDGFVTAPK